MRKGLIGLTAFIVVATAAALPVGAGSPIMLTMTVAPTSGEAGTDAVFTSTDPCPFPNTDVSANAPGDMIAALSLVPEPTDPSDYVADALTDLDGDWSITYTIPDSEPEGDITFYGWCLYETWPPSVERAPNAVPNDYFVTGEYAPVVFTVTAPPPSTTTTSTTAAPTTTTTVSAPTLVASPTTVEQGGTIAVNASGFKPGSNVVITLQSDPVNLGTFVADSAGKIATNVVVPADFPTGAHTLTLTGTDIAGAVLVLSTGITVASRVVVTTTAAPVATTTTLPQTGSSFTGPALAVGGILVLGGAAAVLAARRHRSSTR